MLNLSSPLLMPKLVFIFTSSPSEKNTLQRDVFVSKEKAFDKQHEKQEALRNTAIQKEG